MRWTRWTRISAMCAAAVVMAAIPTQSGAELKAWDQEEVALLSKQLNEAVSSLRRATSNDPTLRDGAPLNRRSAQDFRDSLKALESACRQLARKLEQGADRAETVSVAKRIGMLIRRTQTTGRKVMIKQSQWAAVDPAIDLINRLSPYYSEKSPLLPQVLQR